MGADEGDQVPELGASMGVCQQDQAADVDACAAEHAQHCHYELFAVSIGPDDAQPGEHEHIYHKQDDDLQLRQTQMNEVFASRSWQTILCQESHYTQPDGA